ncbi:hypothetical protein TNIN_303721 [Trichonephila inaurata madagascariensis]|uniref:sn-1-specific diacylglycerol lipase ABHD11 n=1 Tax=Trichonephila inaurata madagascariensis TaxID=2747483 RepID=A0A8X6XYF7_9ARAC|nr:hypothetical protein TNIN_303721 [Trichonephila inaurata madagascariensis]
MKLAYELFLPSEGFSENSLSPVIMLHGRTNSKKTWKKFAPEIAERTKRQVYIYDARNHGDSSWDDEMDLDILTEDLEEFMNDFDMEQAILIGHSMGGKTAMTFALKKPEAVEKLIVEDTDTEDYPEFAKQVHLGKINILRGVSDSHTCQCGRDDGEKSCFEFFTRKTEKRSKATKEKFDLSLGGASNKKRRKLVCLAS